MSQRAKEKYFLNNIQEEKINYIQKQSKLALK